MKMRYKKRIIELEVKKVSFLGRFFGLMFKGVDTKNLLFEFRKDVKSSIHSVFVFFRFLAIWLNEKNIVQEFRIVNPFTFCVKPKCKYSKLVEIPLNNKNKRIINLFVGKRKI